MRRPTKYSQKYRHISSAMEINSLSIDCEWFMLNHGRHEHQVTLSLRVSDVRESLLGHFGCRFHRIIACVWSKKKICVNCASGRTDHLMDMRERFLVLNDTIVPIRLVEILVLYYWSTLPIANALFANGHEFSRVRLAHFDSFKKDGECEKCDRAVYVS